MKILDLVLKNEWFDLIKKGEKREEYREIKPYWISRLCQTKGKCEWNGKCLLSDVCKENGAINTPYTHIKFRRGYTKEHLIFKIENISIGKGKKELGAPEDNVFIIKFSEKEIKQEFDDVFGKVFRNNIQDYFVNNVVNYDKLEELFNFELKKLFSDDKLKFKANNNINDFTLYGADEHTNDIMRKLLK